jgi:hypothetical protein
MRSFVGIAIVSACVFVGATGYLDAQDPAPAPGGQQAAPGGQAGGRGPAPLQNIKVLPKEWTRQQVQALMQTFVVSLGQQMPPTGSPPPPAGQGEGCLHCHIRGTASVGGRGPQIDYASDENPNKDIARTMIQMTMAANADYLKTVGDQAAAEKISCYTCHRGESAKPANMPAAGWGRGGFSLLPAGPPVPQRGAGAAPKAN